VLVFGPNDERQIQDMRRSGALEAMRGDATPSKLSAKMANTLRHRTGCIGPMSRLMSLRCAMSMVPRALGRERIKSKKLQPRSGVGEEEQPPFHVHLVPLPMQDFTQPTTGEQPEPYCCGSERADFGNVFLTLDRCLAVGFVSSPSPGNALCLGPRGSPRPTA
jgi:hypothetical protein